MTEESLIPFRYHLWKETLKKRNTVEKSSKDIKEDDDDIIDEGKIILLERIKDNFLYLNEHTFWMGFFFIVIVTVCTAIDECCLLIERNVFSFKENNTILNSVGIIWHWN